LEFVSIEIPKRYIGRREVDWGGAGVIGLCFAIASASFFVIADFDPQSYIANVYVLLHRTKIQFRSRQQPATLGWDDEREALSEMKLKVKVLIFKLE
jgi:hypothetical protein